MYVYTYTYTYIYIYIYKVITQLKIDTYSYKSKHYKVIRIKLQLYKTVIKQLIWQITKLNKQKSFSDTNNLGFTDLSIVSSVCV